MALLTLGEGYHSFHHRFPNDFRNGIRWYHWDPAKWFIRTLRFSGLATQLRATPPPQVELARMSAEVRDVESRLESAGGEAADHVRRLLDDARKHLDTARVLWREYDLRGAARRHVRDSRRRWKEACRIAAAAMQTE